MAITSNFANLATVTRASKAWDPGWDFVSGSAVGPLVEYASGVARTTPSGLLVEEGTTNEITNPRCEGAIAGTPGTMPTGWLASMAGGAVATVVGSGTADGWPYLDFKISGSPTSGSSSIYFNSSTETATVVTDVWTTSIGVQIIAGDMSNITALDISMVERNSGGGAEAVQAGTNFTPDSDHKRYFQTNTMTDADTAYAQIRLDFSQDGGGAVDLTVRIFAPQLEQKAYPTSPILPTGSSPAASTRAADIVSTNFGSWGSEVASSIYCEFVSNIEDTSGFRRVWSIDDGTNDNRLHAYISLALQPVLFAAVGSVSSVNSAFTSNPISTGEVVKLSAAFSADDFAASRNGATQVTDSSVTMPTGLTTLRLGNWSSGAQQLNGYIKDFRYWPRRLTNAELEALVGN